MINCKLIFVFVFCYGGAYTAPPAGATTNATEVGSKHSEEARIPDDMNIVDYYFSMFGKHLDYDYREPMLTFDEPVQNDLSDDIESEVERNDVDMWNSHSRKKRFILVPANFYNSTRRWYQEQRRLRTERRRLRNERRRQWQQNRIAYLNARSDALRQQASRLSQNQQRQQATRNVIPQSSTILNTANPTQSTSSLLDSLVISESKTIPVKQVPTPVSPIISKT